eukprot:SAG31_NODE_1214_length_9340_cov_30.386799_2_plen_133_part_00
MAGHDCILHSTSAGAPRASVYDFVYHVSSQSALAQVIEEEMYLCTVLNATSGLHELTPCNYGNYSLEQQELLRLEAEAKLNQSKNLKSSTGGMSGAVLKDAVPGEDAVGMSDSNLQVSHAFCISAQARQLAF